MGIAKMMAQHVISPEAYGVRLEKTAQKALDHSELLGAVGRSLGGPKGDTYFKASSNLLRYHEVLNNDIHKLSYGYELSAKEAQLNKVDSIKRLHVIDAIELSNAAKKAIKSALE